MVNKKLSYSNYFEDWRNALKKYLADDIMASGSRLKLVDGLTQLFTLSHDAKRELTLMSFDYVRNKYKKRLIQAEKNIMKKDICFAYYCLKDKI